MSNNSFSISTSVKEILWIVCIPTSIINAIVIFFCLFGVVLFVSKKKVSHGMRNGMELRNKHTILKTLSLTDLSSKNDFGASYKISSFSKSNDDAIGMCMHYFLLAAIICAALRIICEQIIIHFSEKSNLACNGLAKTDIFLTGLTVHFCHWYLWFRQHLFFSNPVLRQYRPRIFTCLSFTACPLMLVGFFINLLIHVWWRDYTVVERFCLPDWPAKMDPYGPYIMVAGSCAFLHIFLTFLFVYPIMRHNAKMKSCKIRRVEQKPKIVSRESDRRAQRHWTNLKMKSAVLSRMVKKAVISCLIAVLIDCIVALFLAWLSPTLPTCFLSILYEAALICNVLCVLYTYPDWENILLICCGQFQSYSSEH